jgi:hypothetical protein
MHGGRATGARFELAPEWSWRDADASAIRAATNLLTPELESGVLPVQRNRKATWQGRGDVVGGRRAASACRGEHRRLGDSFVEGGTDRTRDAAP